MAERNHGLLGIYATLERAESMDEVGAAVLEATLRSGAYNPKLGESREKEIQQLPAKDEEVESPAQR